MQRQTIRSFTAGSVVAVIAFLMGSAVVAYRDPVALLTLMDRYRYRNETRSAADFLTEIVRPRLISRIPTEASEETIILINQQPTDQKPWPRRKARCYEPETGRPAITTCIYQP